MKIAERLRAIATLVPAGATVADIGSDHGLLLDYLLNIGRIEKGYATDNKDGPFKRLLVHFRDEPRVQVYLADGLTGLPADVDAVVIAGMGGLLINRMLTAGRSSLDQIDDLIVSPHQQVAEVRQLMMNDGFRIDDELIVEEDGQFYEVMRFVKGKADYSIQELRYGPLNLKRHDQTLIKKMKARIETIDRLLNKDLPDFRIEELKQEKEWLHQYDQNL